MTISLPIVFFMNSPRAFVEIGGDTLPPRQWDSLECIKLRIFPSCTRVGRYKMHRYDGNEVSLHSGPGSALQGTGIFSIRRETAGIRSPRASRARPGEECGIL